MTLLGSFGVLSLMNALLVMLTIAFILTDIVVRRRRRRAALPKKEERR